MLVDDAHLAEQRFESSDASTRTTVEDGAVVGQHRGRIAPDGSGIFKGVHHVGNVGDAHHVGDQNGPRVIVDEIEDLHIGSVSQPPMGDVGLPALIGQRRFEPDERVVGRLFGSCSMNPRRARMRLMVETDGTSVRRLERCQWMARGPASNPSSPRCLRRTTISSSTSAEVRLGLV